ncbi:hypothetical protein N7504_003333 [Penicillium tannophilum]|nr:hypothetical protein N7504_003333 [Penicillium tannophilum]
MAFPFSSQSGYAVPVGWKLVLLLMLLFQNVLVGLSDPNCEDDTWKSGTATNATRSRTLARASTPELGTAFNA